MWKDPVGADVRLGATRVVRRWAHRELWLICLLCVTACVHSEHPLSDEETSTIDEELIGSWTMEGDGDQNRCEVRKKKDNVLEVITSDDPPMSLYCTKIGSERFLSCGETDSDTGRKTY